MLSALMFPQVPMSNCSNVCKSLLVGLHKKSKSR